MEISKAQKSDIPEILALQKAAFLPIAEKIGNMQIQPLLQTAEEVAAEFDAGVILKCAEGGKICGSVRAHLDEEGVCRVGKLVVDPEMQRRGIGKRLLSEIEKYFPDAEKFALFTGEITPHTRRLYEKLGYSVVGRKPCYGSAVLFMEKPQPCEK